MTAGSPVTRRLARICAAAALAGVLSLVLAALGTERRLDAPLIALAFCVALAAAELFPVHLVHSGESEDLRLEEAFFVPMAVLLAPVETLLAVGIAITAADTFRRRGLMKTTFNAGMSVTAAALGLVVASLAGMQAGGVRAVMAAALGGVVMCVFMAVSVACVVAIAQGQRFRDVLLHGAGVRAATWLGSLSLGILVALATEDRPGVLLIAVIPVVVLQAAYAGALGQWRQRRQAERLYEAAARIRTSVDSATVRKEAAEAAQELLGASRAHLVEVQVPAAARALRVPIDEGSVLEVLGRAGGGSWTRSEEGLAKAIAGIASSALSNALLYEQLQAITGSLGEGVLALTPAGEITFVNPAAGRLLGWRPSELVGRPVASAVDPAGLVAHPDGAEEWVHLPRLRAGETVRLDEYAVSRSDGSLLSVALTASPVVRDGEVVGVVLALRDVTERKALERRLMHQAFHDQLTGLPNRALFLDRLEHARARGGAGSVALLFVDLDRFKVINDSLGHQAGDDVLSTVASRLVGAVHAGDTVARFGGDEFTVLLEETGSRAEAAATAERILAALRQPIRAGDRQVVLSASIGIAVEEPGNAPSDLLAAADIAMYEAKSAGSDRYVFATPDADDLARAKLDLEMQLRRAIEQGELELEYQPVVRAHGEALHGFEALVRWRHPTLGLLPPDAFMPLAEDTGLVLPLGTWVLESACRAAKEWHERHPGTGAVMAVNLSARQFQHPGLCEQVAGVLARVGLDPSRLTLEITETVVMQDSARTLGTLRALRELGVRLAIDDFGTGYSSLSYLKRFPVDVVKIDKSFVDGLASSSVDREIVAAVIRLANAVGMQTVAEGVETVEQLDQLRLLGCSLVQGYLVSQPQPLDVLHQRLGRTAAAGLPVPRAATDDVRPAFPAQVRLPA